MTARALLPWPQLRKAGVLSSTFVRSALRGYQAREQFAGVRTYCMFIGYPRSGHSLVGSFLDAHPQAVIANELDAMRYVSRGFRRNQVFSMILENSAAHAGHRIQTGYDYTVPNQWQGRWQEIRVIGDKKGGDSSLRVSASPESLARLIRTVAVPVKFVHVLRNPFDNISTMFLRGTKVTALDSAAAWYFKLCETNAAIKRQYGDAVLDLRHESLFEDPASAIAALCAFVGLDAGEAYVADCVSILMTAPHLSRNRVRWDARSIAAVEQRTTEFDFLAGYSFSR